MHEPAHPVVAFDFGTRRIGIAIGDTVTATAAPRPPVPVRAGHPDWSAIEREIRTAQPRLLIVGIPYNADGSAGALTGAARAFAAALRERFGLAVEHVDERWSSLEASAALKHHRQQGTRRRRVRRDQLDSVAAAVILERWLAGERTEDPEA
ncbi:MAG TPA: Holliday junction resolvase RuvX [Steroidobacteraceae bacterium]|nr:Holliday junction resolvase RuvX [Steroidobacteraceae bacterium]